MSKRTHNRRLMLDSEWGYRCSRCDTYKPFEDFHKDRSKPPFYIAYTCKECRKLHKDSEPMISDDQRQIGLDILEVMGYDTTRDVHQQFLDKIERKYGKCL